MTVDVTVIGADQLDSRLIEEWCRIQEAEPSLGSPFFRPEFTLAVAAARSDAYVAILEQNGAVAGFFAYQRGRRAVGGPVGGERSNYQGVIAPPALRWDVGRLLRGCGLRIWDFDHLLTTQPQFRRFYHQLDESPYMDLADGFDAYAAAKAGDGSKVVARVRQQRRRLQRAAGPLRYERHESSIDVLRTMMRWKSEQHRATDSEDRFAIDWNVELMDRIHAQQGPGFRGRLPALYGGDTLLAVAMNLSSHGVYHYWFPTYNKEFSSYSPGMVLLLEIAQEAQDAGIHTLDLGKGTAPYKERLASGVIPVAQGSATVPSTVAALRAGRRAAERAVRGSALEGTARAALRTGRRLAGRGQ